MKNIKDMNDDELYAYCTRGESLESFYERVTGKRIVHGESDSNETVQERYEKGIRRSKESIAEAKKLLSERS